jgi:uncharacterized protein YndB with AHSA1/START domain
MELQAKAEMLIRNPEITSKFWFTKGSGRLTPGAVRWDWEMYDVYTTVDVKTLKPNHRLLITWGSEWETPTTVEWTFSPHGDDATFVRIRNFGFEGDADSVVQQALDSTGGFTWVLAGWNMVFC